MTAFMPFLALMKRELLTSLRRGRTYGLVAFTVAVLFIAVVLAVWTGMTPANTEESFVLFVVVLCWAACLFVTPLAATAVCVEKQTESFDMLRTTLIRPGGIIAAKLANVLGVYLFMVIACMPVVGVLFFFAGIEWDQFIRAFVLIGLLAAACASVGLVCSCLLYRTIPSIAASYVGLSVFLGALVALPFLVGAFVLQFWLYAFRGQDTIVRWFDQHLIEPVLAKYFYVWCPPAALVGVLENALSWKQFWRAAGAQTLFIALCFFLAVRILRRPAKPPKVDARKPIDDKQVLRRRRKRFPFYLLDPLRRRKPIADGRNPLFVKELYTGMVTKGTGRVRLFYVYAILSLLLGSMSLMAVRGSDFNETLGYCLLGQTIAILAVAPALVATTMAKEHELGNMDMLRTTLLGPWEIVWGKLAAGFASAGTLALATVLGMAPAFIVAFRDAKSTEVVFAGLGTLVASLALAISLTLRVSLRARRTASALVVSYLACLVLMAGLPAVVLSVVHSIANLGIAEITFKKTPGIIFGLCLVPSPVAVQFENLGEFQFELDTYVHKYWIANIVSCAVCSLYFVRRTVTLYKRRLERDR